MINKNKVKYDSYIFKEEYYSFTYRPKCQGLLIFIYFKYMC